MHTKHEGKEEGVVTMIISNGLFLIGKLAGGNKLLCDPRVFMVIEGGKRIQMSPLPGAPPFITLGNDRMGYIIPETEKNLLDLYYRVTHPEENQEKKIQLVQPRVSMGPEDAEIKLN